MLLALFKLHPDLEELWCGNFWSEGAVMIMECQGLGVPCSGEGFYRIFHTPNMTLSGAGWFCFSCAKTLEDMGATVIDRKEGL